MAISRDRFSDRPAPDEHVEDARNSTKRIRREAVTLRQAKVLARLEEAMSLMRKLTERSGGVLRLIAPYQTDGVKWMIEREFEDYADVPGKPAFGGILADDMGLGKTIQTLAVVASHRLPRATLIVTLKSLVTQWASEAHKFFPQLDVVVLAVPGDLAHPIRLTRDTVVVTTYSVLASGPGQQLDEAPFARVILDEAHEIKNRKSNKFRVAAAIPTNVRWLLTGTPVTRGDKDVSALFEFLRAAHLTDAAAKRLILRRTREDVAKVVPRLRLPTLTMRTISVKLSHEERALYDTYRARGQAVLLRETTDAVLIDIVAQMRRCLATPRTVDDAYDGPTSKIEALARAFAGHPKGSRTLVFYQWHTEADDITARLNVTGCGGTVTRLSGRMTVGERHAAVAAFMSPNCGATTMLVQMQTGGAGLNLYRATHVYITSPHWNAANELQAIARVHRTGLEHTLIATRLVVPGTVDSYIHSKQQGKLDEAAAFFNDDRIRDALGDTKPVGMDFREIFFDT